MKIIDYKKENKGITLIALIITIIVLLILAGVTISFVMQGGILDKSQLAVDEYKNSASDEDNTLKDIDKYLNDKLDKIKGVDMNEVKKDFEKDPEKYKHPDQSSTNGDRAVGTDGKPVNMDLWDGWTLQDDGAHLDGMSYGSGIYPSYHGYITEEGKIQGTVPQYIYSEENEKVYPVVSMVGAFYGYIDLKEAPTIPTTVTDMSYTFSNCIELIKAPIIPDLVIDMANTFSYCSALTEVPTIPNSVTNMNYTFKECSALTKAPVISDSVTNMCGAFSGCSALTEAPTIPDSVIIMTNTFQWCSALTEAPTIPRKVTDIGWAFYGCSALTGDLIINAENVEVYEECLNDAAENPGCELKLSGDCPQLNEILGTATSSNVSLKQ